MQLMVRIERYELSTALAARYQRLVVWHSSTTVLERYFRATVARDGANLRIHAELLLTLSNPFPVGTYYMRAVMRVLFSVLSGGYPRQSHEQRAERSSGK